MERKFIKGEHILLNGKVEYLVTSYFTGFPEHHMDKLRKVVRPEEAFTHHVIFEEPITVGMSWSELEKRSIVFQSATNSVKSMKTKLVPFDVSKARFGATVVTRDGEPVRIVCYDRKNPRVGCITALVTASPGEEKVVSYHPNGRTTNSTNPGDTLSKLDLFIQEEVKEISAADLTGLKIGDSVWDMLLDTYGRIVNIAKFDDELKLGVRFVYIKEVRYYTGTGRYQIEDKVQRLYRTKVSLTIPMLEV